MRFNRKAALLAAAATTTAVMCASQARAMDVFWTGFLSNRFVTDGNWNGLSAPGPPTMPSGDMNGAELGMVVRHFNQFGEAYAQSFLAAVPEPATALFGAALGGLGLLRRRRG